MSCCQRASVPMPDRWAPTAAVPAPVNAVAVPLRLRFTGARALSLPVGARRVLAQPGQELPGLSEVERQVLWRTGLFEAVG